MIFVRGYILTAKDAMDGLGREGDSIVDYGIDSETLQNVCLPQENWATFIPRHCTYNEDYGEWVLKE